MVDVPSEVRFTEVDALPEGLTSAIGHADTAAVLGYPVNRVNVHLAKGDTAYVAQLQGGRLPEGCTTLPEGFFFKYVKVEILCEKREEVYDQGFKAGQQSCTL